MDVITWVLDYNPQDLLDLPIFTFLPDSHSFKESVIPLAQAISSPKTTQIVHRFFDFPTHRYSASFTFISHKHYKQFLTFIHQLHGNQKKFWLPVWYRNFKLAQPFTPPLTPDIYINVVHTRFLQFTPPELIPKLRIFIFKPLSNTKFLLIIRKITKILENSEHEEQLHLSQPITHHLLPTEPIFIGKLALVRLASDTINFKFLFSANQEFKKCSVIKTELEFLELTFEWLNS